MQIRTAEAILLRVHAPEAPDFAPLVTILILLMQIGRNLFIITLLFLSQE